MWPFTSPPPPPPKKEENIFTATSTWVTSLSNSAPSPPLSAAVDWVSIFASTVVALAVINGYTRYLRRIPSAPYVRPELFHRKSLWGKVTSVGDGDGFHFYHTPGGRLTGWGWLKKVPTSRAGLKGNTISIRLAGIDAPEGAYFGRPVQPFSYESHAHLKRLLTNRSVRVNLYSRDRYERIVASCHYFRFGIWKTDVSLEMLKQGLATTYEAKSGVEFGGKEEIYRKAEEKAKMKKLGIWGIKGFESPREYKNRHMALEKKQEEKVAKEKVAKEKVAKEKGTKAGI